MIWIIVSQWQCESVPLNFRNFRNFRNSCFAVCCQVLQIVLRKVSQILFFAVFVRFAATFTRFRKYEFVRFLSVSQEFANRFFVSQILQGFRNGQFADEVEGDRVDYND